MERSAHYTRKRERCVMMRKRKKFTRILSPNDLLDVTLEYERGTIFKFALNYRAIIKGRLREIYRVDNFHGFLHEQRFWRSPNPIRLRDEEHLPLKAVLDKYVLQIFQNYHNYKRYFRESMRKRE
jgi:hypothetical protein